MIETEGKSGISSMREFLRKIGLLPFQRCVVTLLCCCVVGVVAKQGNIRKPFCSEKIEEQ